MIATTPRAYRRAATTVILAALSVLLAGCALPWDRARPSGEAVMRSPECHCRYRYPAAWYFTPSNGDPARPILGLDSFDASDTDHVSIPTTFASVGVDWQSDPIGQLYLAATTQHFSPWPAQHLTVSGWSATAYAHWTAAPSRGGVYQEHVYLFVPWYQRLYDIWLQAANPPGNDISSQRGAFERLLRSMTIVPPNAVP